MMPTNMGASTLESGVEAPTLHLKNKMSKENASVIFEKKITLGAVIQIITLIAALIIAYTRQEYRISALENTTASLSKDLSDIKIALIRAGLIYNNPPYNKP